MSCACSEPTARTPWKALLDRPLGDHTDDLRDGCSKCSIIPFFLNVHADDVGAVTKSIEQNTVSTLASIMGVQELPFAAGTALGWVGSGSSLLQGNRAQTVTLPSYLNRPL